MRVRRLSPGELEHAEPWWDALLARSRADSFFLRHRWLLAWWRHFGDGREPRVLVVEERGRLVGIAPFCVTAETEHRVVPVREVAFLGRAGVTGDNLDVIAEPGREAAVLAAVLDHLEADPGWDLLRASDLPEGSPTPAALFAHARKRGLAAVPGPSQTCPFLPLPPTWDAFLSEASPNLRSNLRRRERRLRALGVRIEEAHGGTLVPALETLFALHGARWRARGRSGNFLDPRVRAFHHEVAPALDAERSVGLWTARVDGRPASALYGFRHRGRFLYYQAGLDPALADLGLGVAVMGHAIRRSIEDGLAEFDFLRGDEDYKRRWTDRARTTRTVVLVRPSLRGIAWRTIALGRRMLRAAR